MGPKLGSSSCLDLHSPSGLDRACVSSATSDTQVSVEVTFVPLE